jgi:hypothetical protein
MGKKDAGHEQPLNKIRLATILGWLTRRYILQGIARLLVRALASKLGASSDFQMWNAIDSSITPLHVLPIHPTLPLSGRQEAWVAKLKAEGCLST